MDGKIKIWLVVILATVLAALPQLVAYADPIPWPGG
jgi:hypothetical protein